MGPLLCHGPLAADRTGRALDLETLRLCRCSIPCRHLPWSRSARKELLVKESEVVSNEVPLVFEVLKVGFAYLHYLQRSYDFRLLYIYLTVSNFLGETRCRILTWKSLLLLLLGMTTLDVYFGHLFTTYNQLIHTCFEEFCTNTDAWY